MDLVNPLRIIVLGLLCAGLSHLFVSSPAEAEVHPGAKLVAHIQPRQGAIDENALCVEQAPLPTGCREGTGSDLVVQGDLNVESVVYLLAVDLETDLGLSRTVFSLAYDGTGGSGVDVDEFISCAPSYTTSEDWPAPGREIEFLYPSCQGTEPGGEPSGKGAVVLAALVVTATSPDVLAIRPPPIGPAWIQDCEQGFTRLPETGLAQVAFGGGEGWDPCDVDFYSAPQTCCRGSECSSEPWIPCFSSGGTPMGFISCLICATPAGSRSWGSIKSRYE